MRNRPGRRLRQWLGGWVAAGCLATADGGQPRFDEPVRVYYQDSQKYLLHHHFATVRLEPFRGLSREDLSFGGTQLTAELVTQAGAVSVTNPEGNARPEVVDLTDSGGISLVQPTTYWVYQKEGSDVFANLGLDARVQMLSIGHVTATHEDHCQIPD